MIQMFVVSILFSTTSVEAKSPKHTSRDELLPVDFVNVLGGTNNLGSQDISYGNVLPEVLLPWGFDGWAPQTSPPSESGWWFLSSAHNLYGVRCTKQPSPWIRDYGQFRVMAHLVNPSHESATASTPYDPKTANWSPYHFQATLMAYGTTTGVTTLEVAPFSASLCRALLGLIICHPA
jgi:putative alpha-1,2-mannosidase